MDQNITPRALLAYVLVKNKNTKAKLHNPDNHSKSVSKHDSYMEITSEKDLDDFLLGSASEKSLNPNIMVNKV